jgi:hypothetical protein
VVGSYHFFAIIIFQSISGPALSCFKVTSSLCFNFFTPLLNLCSMHCPTFLPSQLLHFCFVPTCIEVGVSREVVIYFLVFKHSLCVQRALSSLQLLCFYFIPMCAFWVAFFYFLVFKHSMLLSTLRELSPLYKFFALTTFEFVCLLQCFSQNCNVLFVSSHKIQDNEECCFQACFVPMHVELGLVLTCVHKT